MSEEYEVPLDLLYSREHVWLRVEEGEAVLGITDYAQKKLREVVYVELPNVGHSFTENEPIATLESVKASAEVYAPISGRIVEVNSRLIDTPELINEDPYGEGWIAKIEVDDEAGLENLLEADEYLKYIEDLEESG